MTPVSLLQGERWPALLIVNDGLMLLVALAAVGVRGDTTGNDLLLAYPVLVIGLLVARRMYTRTFELSLIDNGLHIAGATSFAAVLVIAVGVELNAMPSNGTLEHLWAVSTALIAAGRGALGFARRRAARSGLLAIPTLIIGSDRVAAQVERKLRATPELGLLPVGFVDHDPVPRDLVPGRVAPIVGAPADLTEVIAETGAKHVIFAYLSTGDAVLLPLVRICESLRVKVSIVPRLFEVTNDRFAFDRIGPMPVFELRTTDPDGWKFSIKHGLEWFAALVLTIVAAPLMVGLAIGVKLSSPGPVLLRQRRIGRDGREFDIFKFRSMRVGEQEHPCAPNLDSKIAPGGVEGEDRRTGFGCFIRRTSLDELPQLFNVLRNEMALVGPRPERPEWVEWFGKEIHGYTDRHRVRSGITGIAQVRGLRGQTPIEDRVEWDNWYIENWSLSLDVKILAMTVGALFQRAE